MNNFDRAIYVLQAWQRGCDYDDYYSDVSDAIEGLEQELSKTAIRSNTGRLLPLLPEPFDPANYHNSGIDLFCNDQMKQYALDAIALNIDCKVCKDK